jgi:uncharacterized membrane protein YphA (DoxX/SURF4 family)
VTLSELVIGLLLILGPFTGLAAFAGLTLNLAQFTAMIAKTFLLTQLIRAPRAKSLRDKKYPDPGLAQRRLPRP